MEGSGVEGMEVARVEPWLRGTLAEVDAVRRQVLHALELAGEDATRWCGGMGEAEIHARPFGMASVAFHLRHLARSLDRLMTYAEGHGLSGEQMTGLRSEMDAAGPVDAVLGEFRAGLAEAGRRVLGIDPMTFDEVRWVGRERLATTVGGLVVHCAEHTQRHAGQMVTTAKVVRGMRDSGVPSTGTPSTGLQPGTSW